MRNHTVSHTFIYHCLWLISLLFITSCTDSNNSTTPIPTPYSIGGTIIASGNSMVDSDINDPNAAYQSNDTLQTAQIIGNPVNLGGYLNIAGKGEEGRSYAAGDIDDYFHSELLAGQVITLIMSESPLDGLETNDLDLYIYNDKQNLIASSKGTGSIEQHTILASGQYYINVSAWSGASNYTLSTGLANLSKKSQLSSESLFVDGEVIIKFKSSTNSNASALARSYGLNNNANNHVQRAMLWRLPIQETNRSATPQKFSVTGLTKRLTSASPNLQRKLQTLEMIKALRADPNVEYAEPNYIVQAYATPDDSYYDRQWHYPLINLENAWNEGSGTTEETIVAVIDSGILPSHPDLINRQTSTGYDFISSADNSGDNDGLDSDPTDESDGESFYVFHGTHVAGTIAAQTNNNLGVAGVAGEWPIKIMPLRALGSSGGSVFDIAQAIYYAAGESNNSGIRLTGNAIADVINMSLGGPDQSTTLNLAISTARAKGVIIIAAAGNESSSEPSYPAASAGVVSVSSVGADKALAPYSNFGSTIDIAAPGGNSSADYNADGSPDGILSTDGNINGSSVDSVYTYLQGTSMASPHVAGVAALMKTVYPVMTPEIFDAWLVAGELTEDIGTVGRDNSFGHGLIDAYKSVITAKNAAVNITAPLLYFTPNKIDFGLSNNSINIDVSNLGGEIPAPPSVQAPTDDADWLQVSISSVDSNGLGRYAATINRSLLPSDGHYSATITFLTSTGTVNIPVTAQKISSSQASNAGLIYILVLDPDTYTTIAGQAATVHNGVYSYYISSLPADDFIIIAGSDSDNDNLICDAGESCGSYPLYGSSSIISVNDDVTGIDFGVSYRVTLDSTASGFSKSLNLQKSIGVSR